MTFAAFEHTMDRLSGLKFKPASLRTHWEALSDLSASELDAAVSRATRECEEFPAPKMLRVFVDEYRGQVRVPEEDASRGKVLGRAKDFILPDGTAIHITREWSYYCEDCSDTGLRSFWCGAKASARQPWLPMSRCGRSGVHGEHDWVEACPCAATNPDVLRKKARAQQVTRKQADR